MGGSKYSQWCRWFAFAALMCSCSLSLVFFVVVGGSGGTVLSCREARRRQGE